MSSTIALGGCAGKSDLRFMIAIMSACVCCCHLSAGDSEGALLAQRIDALSNKIAALETRLAPGATMGQGAFIRGPTMRVDGGNESMLERVRRVESELVQARTLIAGRERELAAAQTRERELAARGSSADQTIAGLEHIRDQLITARQVLDERQTTIDGLAGKLTATELARMRAEKAYYGLAATVLRLQANQPAAINDLQDLIRLEARTFIPVADPASAQSPQAHDGQEHKDSAPTMRAQP